MSLKQPDDLAIGKSLKSAVTTSLATTSNTINLAADIVTNSREVMHLINLSMQPAMQEAKIESMVITLEGIKELVLLGMTQEEAKAYLND